MGDGHRFRVGGFASPQLADPEESEKREEKQKTCRPPRCVLVCRFSAPDKAIRLNQLRILVSWILDPGILAAKKPNETTVLNGYFIPQYIRIRTHLARIFYLPYRWTVICHHSGYLEEQNKAYGENISMHIIQGTGVIPLRSPPPPPLFSMLKPRFRHGFSTKQAGTHSP